MTSHDPRPDNDDDTDFKFTLSMDLRDVAAGVNSDSSEVGDVFDDLFVLLVQTARCYMIEVDRRASESMMGSLTEHQWSGALRDLLQVLAESDDLRWVR